MKRVAPDVAMGTATADRIRIRGNCEVSIRQLTVEDTGFDPIPANGTVEYVVSVFNNGSDPTPPTTISLAIPATTIATGITEFSGCAPAFPVAGPATLVCDVPALAPDQEIEGRVFVRTTQAGVGLCCTNCLRGFMS